MNIQERLNTNLYFFRSMLFIPWSHQSLNLHQDFWDDYITMLLPLLIVQSNQLIVKHCYLQKLIQKM